MALLCEMLAGQAARQCLELEELRASIASSPQLGAAQPAPAGEITPEFLLGNQGA